MSMILVIAIFVLSLAAGAAFGYMQHRRTLAEMESEAEEERARILGEVRELGETALVAARKDASDVRLEEMRKLEERLQGLEEELHEYELGLEREAQRIALERKEVDEQFRALEQRRTALKKRYEELQKLRERRKQLNAQRPQLLEERAGITRQELVSEIKNKIIERARKEATDRFRESEEISESDYTPLAKRIMGIAIGRISPVPFSDRIPGPIKLEPERYDRLRAIAGDDLAGVKEIIGKEFTVQEDQEGNIVLRIEGVDTVGREVARRLLEKLSADVKDMKALNALWERKLADMDSELIGHGRKAFKLVGLKPKTHVEILKLLGRLYYRTSYYQNQWLHSIEAAHLMGLMVHELGMDSVIARRAALLHDIGKAMTHEKEGSHALLGAEAAERYGEDPVVVNAIAAHHGDVPAETFYARLVMASDALSGARPGARREISDIYMERIKDLEALAMKFPGVTEVYAVQAGREIRVIVDEQHVTDEDAYRMASKIAGSITDELVFPGEIKVTVIRTYSAEEVAR